jgi:hypothetical protein
VSHNLEVDSSFRILNIYLTANDTSDLKYFCLQYFSIAAGDIVLSMDETDVIVTTASDYSAYNAALVVVEFVTGVT